MTITLTAEQITEFAVKLEAAKVPYAMHADAKAITGALMYDDLSAIGTEMHRRSVIKAIETFDTTPAIRAYMLETASKQTRGLKNPELADFRYFAKAAQRTTNQYGKTRPAYSPKGGCEMTMALSKGVRFLSSQESYSDDSVSIIPVAGDLSKADMSVCNQNVHNFFRYADSHTGMAGSGCNYSASLEQNEHGAFIVLHCRASIAD